MQVKKRGPVFTFLQQRILKILDATAVSGDPQLCKCMPRLDYFPVAILCERLAALKCFATLNDVETACEVLLNLDITVCNGIECVKLPYAIQSRRIIVESVTTQVDFQSLRVMVEILQGADRPFQATMRECAALVTDSRESATCLLRALRLVQLAGSAVTAHLDYVMFGGMPEVQVVKSDAPNIKVERANTSNPVKIQWRRVDATRSSAKSGAGATVDGSSGRAGGMK
jgi:hypothetical protein